MGMPWSGPTAVPGADRPVRGLGGLARLVGIDGGEGMQLRVEAGDPVEAGLTSPRRERADRRRSPGQARGWGRTGSDMGSGSPAGGGLVRRIRPSPPRGEPPALWRRQRGGDSIATDGQSGGGKAMAASLSGRAAVVGIGETAYRRGSDRSALALQLEASLSAIEDAGLEPKDIDGILPYASGAAVAEDFITNFGLEDVTFSATTPMGGASCVAAIQAAAGRRGDGPLPKRAAAHRAARLFGLARGVEGRRHAAIPRRLRVRDAVGDHRPGATLRPDGAPPHGSFTARRPTSSPRSRSPCAATPC